MFLGSLLKRPGRSIMTILAVMISTSLLISILSISEGMREHNRATIETGDQDIVITAMGLRGGIRGGREIADRLESDTENISTAAPVLISSLGLVYNDKRYPVVAIGVIPETIEKFLSKDRGINLYGLEMEFNDWFETPGDPHFEQGYQGIYTGEILVSANLLEATGATKGSTLSFGLGGYSNRNLTVAGDFDSPLTGEGLFGMIVQGIIVMHLGELQSLVGSGIVPDTGEVDDRVSSIVISVTDDKKSASDVESITLSLQEVYPLFAILTRSDRMASVEQQSEIADIFYTSAGSVSLVIGLLFVACIMVISVYERQKEIGILRAIGISKRTIFTKIFSESFVLIVTGAALGIIPGYFGAELVGDFMAGKYGLEMEITSFTPMLVTRCVLYVIIVGSLFSLYPALKASRLRVIDAMRK